MTRPLSDNLFSPTPEFGAGQVLEHLTPFAWLLEIVKCLTGVDVAADLVAPFIGRWDVVKAYGETLINVARCVQAVSADVASIPAGLGWEGVTADAARHHLTSVSASLHGDAEALADTGLGYIELATAMQCGQVAAETLLKAVLDAAIEVAVWVAAGTATSKTQVGTVIGCGMATYKTAHLSRLIDEWSRLVAVARADAGQSR